MFIFWWIFKDIVENQDLYSKRDDLKKINKKFLPFDLKDHIFHKQICRMYILADI